MSSAAIESIDGYLRQSGVGVNRFASHEGTTEGGGLRSEIVGKGSSHTDTVMKRMEVAPPNGPPAAGYILRGGGRYRYVQKKHVFPGIADQERVDHATKLSPAVLTQEHFSGLHLPGMFNEPDITDVSVSALGIIYADQRIGFRPGHHNSVSLMAIDDSVAVNALGDMWEAAQNDPQNFIEALRTRLGGNCIAPGLQAGAFATFAELQGGYTRGMVLDASIAG